MASQRLDSRHIDASAGATQILNPWRAEFSMDSRKYLDKTQIVLPEGTLKRLRLLAIRDGTSMAEIMRRAILRDLNDRAPPERETQAA
jgi:hypothetical protein